MKSEWTRVPLSRVAEVQTGPFGSQLHNKDYVTEGAPIVTVEHLGSRSFTTQNLPCVSEEDRSRLSKYSLNTGDIVFSRVGSVDRCSYVNEANAGWLFSGRCLRVRSTNIHPEFLYYFFCQEQVKEYVKSIAVGATMPSINTKLLNDVEVILPPLPIQRKIASILSALDDKIETNNAICRNLEEQSMALYKSWFVNFEPFQNQDFINTAIGIIPSDWTVGKLGSIANIVTGKRPKRKTADKNGHDNVPILGASGIMGYTNESMYRSKILVIGRVGTLGVVQRVEKDCWPSDNALVIQSPYYEYVKQVLVRFDYLSINRGSTQPLITQTDIKNICVIIPPQHILKQFEYRVGKCMNLYSLLFDETKKLEEMREALLPKLMSGELTV